MTVRPTLISRIDDPRVDVYRDVRDKDLRGRTKLFMAESEMVLRRLLQAPDRLHSIFLSPGKFEDLAPALAVLPESVPVYVAGADVMTQIAGFHIHRGVLAAGVRPTARELALDAALGHLKRDGPLRLLLGEGLTNVDNMGALFRNAAAFGADGLVIDPASCDPLYRKSIRVSMGHVISRPYAVSQAWPEDLERLKREWGITLVGAELTPDAVPLWEMPCTERLGLLFGSEADGLSPGALAACDVVCRIPMSAETTSLNVAVASAVFLYEAARAR